MDETDYDAVCPLCCEELDMSDREFYPCKCGYQVCMWCWHRIRESESGLCPACRTPYGEDPHQFTAMDVEEVLKANKEKEAAAKRERQRQQESSGSGGSISAFSSTGAEATALGGATTEIPKDRSSLANMRVIRRNLVYAVGLPPHAATEDVLRRPEYFGQYGKIAKIVTNRSHPGSAGEVRRASASAYVTFVHKEDTLSCILALDGFYLDGRNIRASYGTSKYCSAFIKNVRCNNPECTYLHDLGAAEDTFTKQEIQAGYVTSGRDVLARQQQLLAEQVRLGQAGSLPRKRVGGGGPSGTGRVATNPVLPPPEYDEPSKPAPALVPPPTGVARAVTTATTLNPANIAAKLGRSSSVGVATPAPAAGAGNKSPVLGATLAPAVASHRKSQNGPLNPSVAQPTAAPTTAASVVVTGRTGSKAEAEPHATLTPLTPLKRTTVKTATVRASSVTGTSTHPSATVGNESEGKLTPLRNGTNKKAGNGMTRSASVGVASGAPELPSGQQLQHSASSGPSLIGGDVIGPPALKPRSGSLIADLGGEPIGPSTLSGNQSPPSFVNVEVGGQYGDSLALSSALGGEVFTGDLPNRPTSAIGSNSHKWNASAVGQIGGAISATPNHFNGGAFTGGQAGSSLLHDNYPGLGGGGPSAVGPAIGGSVIGGSHGFSTGGSASSSSALASILGISLPTGSGSLQETSNLWLSGSTAPPPPLAPSPLSSLNGSVLPSHDVYGGRPASAPGSSLIGGVPIGGSSHGNNMSDMSLLQSLLPNVHITSGAEAVGFGASAGGGSGGGGFGGWSGAPSGPSVGMGSTIPQGGNIAPMGWNGPSGIAPPPMAGQSIGTIGSGADGRPTDQRRGPGIW